MKVLLSLIITLVWATLWAQENPVALKYAQQLLYTAQTGESATEMETALASYDAAALQKELNTDALRKAFWINIYNASVQNALAKNPDWFSKPKSFLKRKFIIVAGNTISPNDIQNALLRNDAAGKPVKGKFAKKFAVENFDNRIYFALNNGSADAPPIYFYEAHSIEEQLKEATRNYIKSHVKMTERGFEVNVPEWFNWYLANFGGTDGLIALFRKQEVVYMNLTPRIVWLPYNWNPALKNFAAATADK
jgi:hypothetical protein